MSDAPKAGEAKAIAEAVKREGEQFDAFLRGYVYGAQDHANGHTPDSKSGLEDRIQELWQQENPEGWL